MGVPAEEKIVQPDALRVEGLGKRFGGLEILKNLTFTVRHGERRAFIGPNGAGKTTLFNMIAGDLQPTAGDIFFFTENITRLPNYQRVRKGMVRTFQKNNLFSELSVLENLLLVLQMKTGTGRVWYRIRSRRRFPDIYDLADELLATWGLAERSHTLVKHLSYGEQRQLEILLGIATEPKILLLDEPTAGMSNQETQQILKLLQQMPRDLTLLIIEHDMDVVFGLADRVTVLYNGGILLEGDPRTIQTDPRVYEIYFGKKGGV
ncbi:ABC transporter ATP-binding protein [Effusibacillus pohliae]|uniref:ABC transporter ATP-binding protein n=1 Tax=Effusibacillus pohliae TaxID=232270 RepID=UPI0003633021|nr:ABC transporter ATP-binding protein [Effusibacillus pohliae]